MNILFSFDVLGLHIGGLNIEIDLADLGLVATPGAATMQRQTVRQAASKVVKGVSRLWVGGMPHEP